MSKIIAGIARVIVSRLLNPSILWCYGWKRETTFAHGVRFEAWVCPDDGIRYSMSRAIERCESKINTDGQK